MAEADVQEMDEEEGPTTAYCRHCGKPSDINTDENPDWQCQNCSRYQAAVVCPTCKSVVNEAQLPPDQVPPPHSRARRAMLRAEADKSADAGGNAHGKGAGVAASGKEG